jgi:hypothetical protein
MTTSKLSTEELENELLLETKQGNMFRLKRNKAKSQDQKNVWQTLILLSDSRQEVLKNEIVKSKSKTMKTGLGKPAVRGLKKVCARVVKATGLKVDGTLKKGYKYIKGGKVVKVVPKKKPIKKPVKKRAVKKVVKAKPVRKRTVKRRGDKRAA